MAIIGKIRKQSGLLIGGVGLAMLLFVTDGLFSSGGPFNARQDNEVGEVWGEGISREEFDRRVELMVNERTSQGQPAGDQLRNSVRSEVWELMLQERIIEREMEELGLDITTQELFNEITQIRPNSSVVRYFTDPATQQVIPALQGPDGQLDPQKLLLAIQNLYESEQDDQWIPIERAIKNDKYVNKYYDLLRKGYFVTDVEAKDGFGANAASVGFRYVVKGFETIADSTIAVTDAEAKDYYNAHVSDQVFYQKEDERAVQYVLFEVVASAEDIEEARQEMEELRPEFEVAENDTFFVLDNAENRTNPIRYYKQGAVPPEMDSLVANADTGALYGPYQHEGAYHLTKVIGIKTTPDSIQARHILIQVAANDSAGSEAARNQLDSLRQVIAENDNFGDIARQFSQDNSAQNGGELPVFGPGQMVLPFEDACIDTDPGEMVIVQSRFGVHLIEVMDKSAPKRQVALAVVDRVIRPSKTTYDVTYDEASKFAYASQDAESFTSNATASQYIIRPEDRIRKETPELRGVARSRSVIQWALQQEEVGKVSDPFDLDNQYVVVLLTDIKSAGVRPFDEVVDVAKSEVIKTKKAEKITAEMSGQTSVDALAAELGLRVETVDDLTFGAYSIPGIRALEMDLMGNIFSLTQGDLSLPLAGNQGVYVVALDRKTESPEATAQDIATQRGRLESSRSVPFAAYDALKKKADLKDTRYQYY